MEKEQNMRKKGKRVGKERSIGKKVGAWEKPENAGKDSRQKINLV